MDDKNKVGKEMMNYLTKEGKTLSIQKEEKVIVGDQESVSTIKKVIVSSRVEK